MHALIEGPAAGDVERNFRQRWNDVAERHNRQLDPEMIVPVHPAPPPQEETHGLVQVARTIPSRTYQFAPDGIDGIARLYSRALGNAERFIYLENQYLWLYPYSYSLGPRSETGLTANREPRHAAQYQQAGRSAAPRRDCRDRVAGSSQCGTHFHGRGLQRLQEEAPEAAREGRIRAFCLATGAEVNGEVAYRPIYVHAKVAIVDDVWTTVGSANLNNRGMRDDTEMNVAVLDPELARDLRLLLTAEHLGLVTEDTMLAVSRHLGHQRQPRSLDEQAAELLRSLHATLGDPLEGLHLMVERARGQSTPL